MELAHEGVVAAFEDVGHLGLARVAGAAGQHRDAHAVAVERVLRVALAHEDRLAAVVGQEGVAPVALAHERALHDLRAHGVAVVAVAVGGQIVVEHEFAQRVDNEHLRGMRRGACGGKERLHVELPLGLSLDEGQHALAYVFLAQSF